MGNVVVDTGILTAIPAAVLLGMVAENAATNLCLQSQTFDNASWVKTNATVTANTQSAPDGTLTADTVLAIGALGTVTQTITATAVAHAFGVYMKRLVGTGSVALVLDGTVTDVDGLINSSTWTRVSATKTLTAGAKDFTVRVSTLNDSVAIWGAQVETGSDPTSYIATTTVAVVRNVDTLSYPMPTNLDGALATTYLESYPLRALPPAGINEILIWGGGGNPRPQLFATGTSKLQTISGAVITTTNAANVGAVNKSASAWSGVTASACLNGGAVATGAFTPFTPAGNLYIAVNSGGTESLNGYLRNLKFYNVRIADADLRVLTA